MKIFLPLFNAFMSGVSLVCSSDDIAKDRYGWALLAGVLCFLGIAMAVFQASEWRKP